MDLKEKATCYLIRILNFQLVGFHEYIQTQEICAAFMTLNSV